MALKALATVTGLDTDENDAALIAVGLTVIIIGADVGDVEVPRYGVRIPGFDPSDTGIVASIERAILTDMAGHGVTIDPSDSVRII
jgi:3D (Asp-Asp-Asp) domain-containing protein